MVLERGMQFFFRKSVRRWCLVLVFFASPAHGQFTTWPSWYDNPPAYAPVDPHPGLLGIDHSTFEFLSNRRTTLRVEDFSFAYRCLDGDIAVRGPRVLVDGRTTRRWGGLQTGLSGVFFVSETLHDSGPHTGTLKSIAVTGLDAGNKSVVRLFEIGHHTGRSGVSTGVDITPRFSARKMLLARVIAGDVWAYDAAAKQVLRLIDTDADGLRDSMPSGFPLALPTATVVVGRIRDIAVPLSGPPVTIIDWPDSGDPFRPGRKIMVAKADDSGQWSIVFRDGSDYHQPIPHVRGHDVIAGPKSLRVEYPIGGEVWASVVHPSGGEVKISNRVVIDRSNRYAKLRLKRPLVAGQTLRLRGKLPGKPVDLKEYTVQAARPFFWLTGPSIVKLTPGFMSLDGGNLPFTGASLAVSVSAGSPQVVPSVRYHVQPDALWISSDYLLTHFGSAGMMHFNFTLTDAGGSKASRMIRFMR